MKKLLFILILFIVGCPGPNVQPDPPPLVDTVPVQDVIDLINKERQKANVPPLAVNPTLMKDADNYCWIMQLQNKLSHDLNGSLFNRIGRYSPDALSPAMRAPVYTPQAMGENIAWGNMTADAVVKLWMNSPGHRANILNPTFKDTGVGIRGKYYDQMFGRQR